ncbi:AdoMet-homocysteine methyltransferase [Marasmius tenuissimus]|uniref:AdoMet-homocysteine methyltransferase n=1 Tax=Marasmius tenuissimus TaxID=585030 RepID=A0ABR3A4C0_9AGAR
MVIMWANSDGSFTVSQRQASGYREPEVVDNPPRVATVATAASSSSGEIKYAFTLPHDGQTTQNLVWAFGDTNPGTSDPKARLQQHSAMGRMHLDLSKSGNSGTPSGGGNSGSGENPGSGGQNPPDDIPDDIPLLPYQRLIVAHAIFCTVGFLLFLPAGALLARYLRTFSSVWFKGHWIIQWLLAGSSIVIGVALGIQSVVKAGAMHLDDTHKKWGIALFVLYIVQCLLGAFIHFIKPAKPVGRPIQNYAHAVVGLLTIGIALYQVRTGYKYEWPATTGRGDLGKGVDIVWYAWVVLLPVLYAAGLAFLPKQFRQEKEQRYNTARMSLDRNRYSDEADRD